MGSDRANSPREHFVCGVCAYPEFPGRRHPKRIFWQLLIIVIVSVVLRSTRDAPAAEKLKMPRASRPIVAKQSARLTPTHEQRQREVPDDPPAPLDVLRQRGTSPAMRATRGPFVSVQVNVDALGNNTVGDAANEPSIAIDPTDPSKMAIGWRQFDTIESNFRQGGYAYSTDGGQSWTFPGVLEANVFRSDPVLASDADGNFFYSSLTINEENAIIVDVFKSTDGGMSWGPPVYAFGGDKQWMAVDRTNGIGRGNLYQVWNVEFTCCGSSDFTRSVNGGASFDGPFDLPSPRMKWGTMDVGPDGTLYLAGSNLDETSHVFARSSNAQDPAETPSFEFVRLIDLGGTTGFVAGPNPVGLAGQVWIAADHSMGPIAGNVYILGSVDPPGSDPSDIMFIRSEDDGASWSRPIRVNDDGPNSQAWQWFGTMSVAPDGRIDVAWNDTRNTGQDNLSETYYAFSMDGGLTWSTNVPISPVFDSHVGFPNQPKLGDYYDMISDVDGANLAYAATFNGEQDVYFVRIPADCNDNGISDLCDVDCGEAGCVSSCGKSDDCNGNLIPDECEPQEDCNGNQLQDICDIANETSTDCDGEGVPDECDPDCNDNDTPDRCDLADATSTDCNANGQPDECDIATGASIDCDVDGIPDECGVDCNENALADSCDISNGISGDCDADGVPDECQVEDDCNLNAVPDSCDVELGTSKDTNENGVPDECECDPTTEIQELVPNGKDGPSFFGASVATEGDWTFVGSPNANFTGTRSGVVYAYRRDDNATPKNPRDDSWIEVDRIVGADTQENYRFGWAIAASGDRVLIGSMLADTAVAATAGAAYVFRRDDHGTPADPKDDSWVQESKLIAGDGELDDRFGSSVGLHGQFAIIGAHGDDDFANLSGAAYIFRRDDNGTPSDPSDDLWFEAVKLTDSEPTQADNFGEGVAIHGDRAIVSRRGLSWTGEGRVFLRDDGGTPLDPQDDQWIMSDTLMAATRVEDSVLGISMYLTGNRAILGAPFSQRGHRGTAHIFRFEDNGTPLDLKDDTWIEEAVLVAPSSADDDRFGASVFMRGDWAIVGSPGDNFGLFLGYAQLFRLDDGGTLDDPADDAWLPFEKYVASDGLPGDKFGQAVAMANEQVFVGARNKDSIDEAEGSTYVFAVSSDCTENGVPDTCEPDCNGNTFADSCDVSDGTSEDCNANGIPDECEPPDDCNANGVTDICELGDGTASDCNNNGALDECDLAQGTSDDCNGNGVPDDCEPDCNGNQIADSCDLTSGSSFDCNDNTIPDECEADCNTNGLADECDIQDGTSLDDNADGIPDECCSVPAPAADLIDGVVSAKNRFLSFTLSNLSGAVAGSGSVEGLASSSSGPVGSLLAIRISLVDLPSPFDIFNGETMWVGAPREASENGSVVEPLGGFANFWAAPLSCVPLYADWSPFEMIHAFHEGIVPGGTYHVQVIREGCGADSEANFSPAQVLETATWGDTIKDFSSTPPGPADGDVDIIDALAVIGRFASASGSIVKARAETGPGCVDLLINISDVVNVIKAFQGLDYPFEPTAPDPCNSTCINPIP